MNACIYEFNNNKYLTALSSLVAIPRIEEILVFNKSQWQVKVLVHDYDARIIRIYCNSIIFAMGKET